MKFSSKPSADLAIAMSLFLGLSLVGYFLFSLEIEGPGTGLPMSQVRAPSPKPVKLKEKLVVAEAGPRLAANTVNTPPKDVFKPRPPMEKPKKTPEEIELEQLETMQGIAELVDSGNWQLAEMKLRAYLEKNPDNEGALVEMAMIQLIDKKDPASAKDFLEKALTLNPHNSSVINELMSIYEETGTGQEGIAFLKKLSQSGGSNGMLDFGIGNALLNNGKSEEAVEYLFRALDGGSVDQTMVKEEIVSAFIQSKRLDEADLLISEMMAAGGSQDRMRALTIKSVTISIERGNVALARQKLSEWLRNHPDDKYVRDLLDEVEQAPAE